MPADDLDVIGWDVGGAHLKACWLHGGRVRDVAQWACPLWQGLAHLEAALAQARARWPQAMDRAVHAVTMSGFQYFVQALSPIAGIAVIIRQCLSHFFRLAQAAAVHSAGNRKQYVL